MRRFLRIAAIAIAVLAVVGFFAFRYLTAREPIPEESSYALDLNEIRRLASTPAGDKPVRINFEKVADASLPKGAVFAGESLAEAHPMVHGAFQVVFGDGSYGVIDSAFDEKILKEMAPDASIDAAGFAAVQKALGGAEWIVLTHEHGDHIGGIAVYPEPDALVGRLLLSREQLASEDWLDRAKLSESLRAKLQPVDYDEYHPVAPGVVLVKAAGHSPGTQIIYVSLADGREFLFLGDVAWNSKMIAELWYRPRLVTQLFLGEDRSAVMGQIRRLHSLRTSEPTVEQVVSHDTDQNRRLVETGVLGAHFEL